MEPKRRRRKNDEPPKRQHNVMSLSEKIKILDKLKYSRPATVAKEYSVNESTIRYIQKSEDRIRASVNAGAPSTAVVSYVSRRDSTIEKMEKLLWAWIEEQRRKNVPLCGLLIRSEALNLYETLKANSECDYEENSSPSFVASRGWLENFKKRFSLKNKPIRKSRSADQTSATEFLDRFIKFINEKDYSPEQIFNVDETKLFWKKLPSRTSISRDELNERGLKASKDRLTLLLCGNASGDFKSKPMLIYHTENPFALKGKSKSQLPVFWRSNKIAWVTAELFKDWFENCFLVQVKSYLMEKNLPFKVLLVLDNAVRHRTSLIKNHPNVEIILLPPKTSSFLQPMNQGIISAFLSYYTRRIFSYILEATCVNPSKTVRDCWDSYSIRGAITIIKDSWDEVEESVMNTSWQKIWPGVVRDFKDFPSTRNQVEEIIQLARNVGGKGFDDLKVEEVEDLIKYHQKEFTDDEFVELLSSDDNEDEVIDLEKPAVTSKNLSEIIKIANQLKEKVMEVDPFMERSIKFKRSIDVMMTPYVEMYRNLKMEEEQLQIVETLKSSSSSSTSE